VVNFPAAQAILAPPQDPAGVVFGVFVSGQMPENARVIGAARNGEMDRAGYSADDREGDAGINGDFRARQGFRLEGFIDRS